MRTMYLAPLLPLLLAACAPMAGMAPVDAGPEGFNLLSNGGAAGRPAVQGHLQLFDAAGYRLLDTLTAYNPTDVKKVVLHLQKQSGASSWSNVADTTLTFSSASQLDDPITISNLKMGQTYKVNAETYTTGDVRIDNGVAGDNTSASFTAPSIQTTGNTDAIATDVLSLSLPIKLANKTYDGKATSADGLSITNGTIINPSASESF